MSYETDYWNCLIMAVVSFVLSAVFAGVGWKFLSIEFTGFALILMFYAGRASSDMEWSDFVPRGVHKP